MSSDSRLRLALEMLVGSSEPDELRAMRSVIAEAGGDDAEAALNAIDTLLEVREDRRGAELERAAILLGEERAKRVAAEASISVHLAQIGALRAEVAELRHPIASRHPEDAELSKLRKEVVKLRAEVAALKDGRR